MRELLANNMQYFRQRSGKTKFAICASIGMSRAFWDECEKGNKDPSMSTLHRIAGALGVSVQDLLTERRSRQPAGARK